MIGVCRVCHSSNLSKYLEVGDCLLQQCRNCTFVQVSNKPSEDKIREIYNRDYFTHDKYSDINTLNKENLRRCNFLKSVGINNGASILDFGCASGDFISYAKKNYYMYGYDFSSIAVDLAKQRNTEIAERISAAEISQIEQFNIKFDAICMWDVIEHLLEPLEVCQNLISMLKPKGYLLFSTPDISSLLANLMGSYWHFMTPPEHLSFFTSDSISQLAIKTNTEVIMKINHGKWGNLIFLLKKLKKKFKYSIPYKLIEVLESSPLRYMPIYVPSNDIQYVALQKRNDD